jgi:hypothetical protein
MAFDHYAVHMRVMYRTGDQRGGSEWEPIKIILEGDGYSNKMTTTKHISDSTTQVGQDHVAIGVLLVLETNNHQNLPENAVEQATQAAHLPHGSSWSQPPVRPVQAGSHETERRITQNPPKTHRVTLDLELGHPSGTWRFSQKASTLIRPVQLTGQTSPSLETPNPKDLPPEL